jgi:hypothetical protein
LFGKYNKNTPVKQRDCITFIDKLFCMKIMCYYNNMCMVYWPSTDNPEVGNNVNNEDKRRNIIIL